MAKKYFTALLVACALLSACSGRQERLVTIYHTNDIQGFYWPRPLAANQNKETGGMAVLKALLTPRKGEDYLLFDTGDAFSKTQEGQLGRLLGAVELMNQTGYSAATLSAGDFALGSAEVEAAAKAAKFPIVISNLAGEGGAPPAGIQKYIMLERGDLKIAVLGVISQKNFPKNQRNAGLRALDESASIKALIPQVQEEGANLIIVLSSLGFGFDEANKPDEGTLAEDNPEISLILGGNADMSPQGSDIVSKVRISRGAPMLGAVSQIVLTLGKSGQIQRYDYNQIPLDRQIYGEDAPLAATVAALRERAKKATSARAGTLKAALEGASDRPSTLGSYAAQCLRRWAKTDIAIVNSDLFLQNFPAGAVSEGDLLNSIPFNDRVMLLKMRGDELKNALEATLAASAATNWPQTAGLDVVWDKNAPEGQKIQKITAYGYNLRPGALYDIVSTDHIVGGGFGHDEFLNAYEFKNTDRSVRAILGWCLGRRFDFEPSKAGSWEAAK